MPSQRGRQLTNAQLASLRAINRLAGLAVTGDGQRLVRVGEPEFAHEGQYASVFVKVESWHPSIKDSSDPSKMQRSEQTLLIEAGGCVAEVLL
jgi:hypothetical protein